jgi:hypothetical protein
MKTWTESAEQRLASFLTKRPKEWGLDGAAAEEMASDLRSHVHEELERDGVDIVTVEVLERVLVRLGGRPVEAVPTSVLRRATAAAQPTGSGCGNALLKFLLLLGCVIAPIITLLAEATMSPCADTLFAPMPTLWHLLLVTASVVVTVVTAVSFLEDKKRDGVRWRLGVGFSIVISAYYAVLFLPMTPYAFVGIIFGIGLLALAPLSSFLWLIWQWRKMSHGSDASSPGASNGARGQLRIGAVIGFICLLLVEAPVYLTRYGVEQANSVDEEKSLSGVQFLRRWGSSTRLSHICTESSARPSDSAGWVLKWAQGHGTDSWGRGFQQRGGRMREIYYQVTGRSLSDEPRSRPLFDGRSAWDRGFDNARGGDSVGQQTQGLALTESRVDGHLDQASSLSYQEWTCVFTNQSTQAGEARFQAQLPPQGVVSRLTLWVNDEPREAAFSSVSNVKAAYKDVVVVQRRDPVLVNVCGPDRVFVQCFPVPANGGKMKIRLGITSPIINGSVLLPHLLERNFLLSHSLEQQVWMQGSAPFVCTQPELASADTKGMQALTHALPRSTLTKPTEYILGGKSADVAWTEDPFASDQEKFLIRTWEKVTRPPMGKPIFVVDGSDSTRSRLSELKQWLGSKEVILAGDTVHTVAMDRLQESHFQGGCDNTAALILALSQAQKSPGSVIVWFHGPLPLMLGSKEKLLQLVAKGRTPADIYDIPMQVGANRIAEVLTPYQIIQPGPRLPSVAAWLATLEQPTESMVAKYQRSATPPSDGSKVWDHLARYAAFEQLMRQRQLGEIMPAHTAQAAKYQLVTPWSGAVVLETKAQYDKYNLTPVDPKTVPDIPVVPEPSTMALLLPMLWLGLRRRRCAAGIT